MIDPTARRRMRRRYIASGILLLAGALVPPVVGVAVAGDEVGEALANTNRDIFELSDDVDRRYAERIDIGSQSSDIGSGGASEREYIVYIDLKRREDCRVVDKWADAPGLVCTNSPKPTEVAP